MKKDLVTLNFICNVVSVDGKNKKKHGKFERFVEQTMADIFPWLMLCLIPGEENHQRIKELNKKAFKNTLGRS